MAVHNYFSLKSPSNHKGDKGAIAALIQTNFSLSEKNLYLSSKPDVATGRDVVFQL